MAFELPQASQQQQQSHNLAGLDHAVPRLPPLYRPLYAIIERDDDGPGLRCGHTLTAIDAVGEEGTPGYIGPRLILFGGAKAVADVPLPSGSAIRTQLTGATADVHCYDVISNRWTRLNPIGDPPSPRAAHAATAVGPMVVIQGGIGLDGLSSAEDLHVLDLSQPTPRWHKVVVQGIGPGRRYGHALVFNQGGFILQIGGHDGSRERSDVWALDIGVKPYEWRLLEPEGGGPPPCMYGTASARKDGLVLFYGGRDATSMPIANAYGLAKHPDGRWEWAMAPGVEPSARYQHAAVMVNGRFHVSGGLLGGGKVAEDGSSVAVFDTSSGVWLDRNGMVTSSAQTGGGAASGDLTMRCRHAAASVGDLIFIYGGLHGGVLSDDFLVADDSETNAASANGQSAANGSVIMGIPAGAPANGEDIRAENVGYQRWGLNVQALTLPWRAKSSRVQRVHPLS